MTKLFFTLASLSLLATTAVSAPLDERSVSFISDNDLVDAKGLKLNLDILDDLHLLKRKASKFCQEFDNDLVDAKNAKVNVNALNGLHLLKRKATKFCQTSDDDLVDAKGLKINLDLLNNLHLLDRSSQVVDDLLRRSEAPGLEERGCSKKVIQDNDLVDLKGLKAFLNILRRSATESTSEDTTAVEKRGPRIVQYHDSDLLDLSNLGVNVNVLSGRPLYCVPVHHHPKPTHKPTPTHHHTHKPTRKPTHKPTRKPTFTPKPPKHTTTRKHTTHKPTHKPTTTKHHPKPTHKPPTCPGGWHHVPSGSTCGSVYSSDNDLIDLKDLSINVCILDLTGTCGKSSGKHQGGYTCSSAGGCCVKKVPATKVEEDNDLIDLKDIGINIGLLNGLL
ncbi:hypothetical protein OC845_005057 [Tilletia horrida]|nr:hypothetical protein OC845_005057 [Tilletia horrida]